jgi:hypothetical protein
MTEPISMTTLSIIAGIFITGVTGTAALMTMIHMVRTDISTLKMEMSKDRQIVELRISRLEQELNSVKNALNGMMYQMYREGTLTEVNDERQDGSNC